VRALGLSRVVLKRYRGSRLVGTILLKRWICAGSSCTHSGLLAGRGGSMATIGSRIGRDCASLRMQLTQR
jgi:hypothetical protein